MPDVDISVTAINALLKAVPKSALDSAPPTHLPSALPLAFPTDLHNLNLLSTLHLVNAAFSQPNHRVYFAEGGGAPGEAALRGVLGMYLASDTEWGTGNLLSAKAWASGEMNEAKVGEYFGIEILREREHESMKGVRVGERWQPAVDVAEELVKLLKNVGTTINKSKCLGEEVHKALAAAKEAAKGQPDEGLAYAKTFCSGAVALLPILADPYPNPPGTVLPAAPLCLLQDLAYQFGATNSEVPVPEASALANVSPLPLPAELLLHMGILEPMSSLVGGESLRDATGDWWAGKDIDVFNVPDTGDAHRAPKHVHVSRETLDALCQASVQACQEIVTHARNLPASSAGGDGDGDGNGDWKRSLTALDTSRLMWSVNGILDAHGMGVRLIV